MRLAVRAVLLGILALEAVGCGEPQMGNRKETAPVVGQIVVDGAPPSSPIKVMCHPVNGMDQENPSVSWCMTGEDSKFEISTYEAGDGVPPGDYKLTFLWGTMNVVSMSYGGPDKLGGRYDDPEESEFEFTVQAGEPLDLGQLQLTTKDAASK